jgi:hypothetical protein
MFFCLWYCLDDYLAAALGNPGLGHLPIWVVALLSIALEANTTYSAPRK